MAAPPSPANPSVPLPATVLMVPPGVTLRMRKACAGGWLCPAPAEKLNDDGSTASCGAEAAVTVSSTVTDKLAGVAIGAWTHTVPR